MVDLFDFRGHGCGGWCSRGGGLRGVEKDDGDGSGSIGLYEPFRRGRWEAEVGASQSSLVLGGKGLLLH